MKLGNAWGLAMNLSWTMLFSLVLPLVGGIWLDNKLDTTPLFILVGTVLGIFAATLGVARIAIRTFAQVAPERSEEPAGANSEEEPE